MSIHICSKCGHAENIFGSGGGERMCADYNTEFLGGLPLDIRIREQSDSGNPPGVSDPDGQVANIYRTIARRVAVKIADLGQDHSGAFPKIVIQNTRGVRGEGGRATSGIATRSCPSPFTFHPSRPWGGSVSIKSYKWIRRMAQEHGMIEPFEPGHSETMAHKAKIVARLAVTPKGV